jgi:hypothetical protein
VDHLNFQVEDLPEGSPFPGKQAMPLINGERLATIVGPLFASDLVDNAESHEANDGLDPKDAFLPSRHYLTPSTEASPPSTTAEGATVLLRCSCGSWECSYVAGTIEITAEDVYWRNIHRWRNPLLKPCRDFHFSRSQYEEALLG